ncbi:hypothetical protein DVR12_03375 [Chitinophaga silvatica]|uniref:Uncharacterized protein n=1 Tax=Chitinophaga silvatica TaxID=2282649 RepID=A0A3E1YHX4_9BACT|nr:hypothetical protein [Chitinophaga silvatica]RFS26840.1 hypothetical protein DVR12_03375 [Chitinophaga silvatica]
MKHLPATIGLLAILTLLVFFKSDPDRAVQAAPTTYHGTTIFPSDTMMPTMDTVRHHYKMKENKRKNKVVTKPMRDTL